MGPADELDVEMEAFELRAAASCVACTAPLPVGAQVWRDATTDNVTCIRCNPIDDRRSARRQAGDPMRDGSPAALPTSGPNPVLSDGGGRRGVDRPLGLDPRPLDDPSGGTQRAEERTRRIGRLARRLRRC